VSTTQVRPSVAEPRSGADRRARARRDGDHGVSTRRESRREHRRTAPPESSQAQHPTRRARGSDSSRVVTARTTRRGLRQADTRARQMHRLRRTVLVVVSTLLVGTILARGAQDPAVALPRQASLASDLMAIGSVRPGADEMAWPAAALPAAVPTGASASAAPEPAPPEAVEGGAEEGAEEGAAEPITAPGAALAVVPDSASGSLRAVPIPAGSVRGEGRVIRYAVEIEEGLAVDPVEFAGFVRNTLADDRGWQSADGVRFVPVSPEELAGGGRVDLRVSLATPQLTAHLCAPLNVYGPKVSCFMRGRAVINLHRWLRGSASYGTDLTGYRTYLINHEVGHSLSHGHVHCPHAGQPAPIMVQQTLSVEACTPWPWPTRP
jgi:hypothetical protein